MRRTVLLSFFLTFLVAACDEAPTTLDPAAGVDGPAAGPSSARTGGAGFASGDALLLVEPERSDLGRDGRPGVRPTVAAARGPSAGFPTVIVRQGTGAQKAGAAGAPVVDNLADAVARVAAGGTIRVHGGTYEVDEVVIDRPLTVEAAGGVRPLIRNTSATFSFGIFDVPSGTVAFRGLDFELPPGARSSIQARFVYPEVLVEDSRFDLPTDDPAGTATAGVEAGFNDTGTGRMLVTESSFRGGLAATFAFGGGRLDVRDSDLGGHLFSGLQYQTGGNGVVESNEVVGCGVVACAVATLGSDVDLLDNRFAESRTDVDPFGHNLITYAADSEGRVAGNLVDGCGFGQCLAVISRSVVEVVGNEFRIDAAHGTRFVLVASDGTVGSQPDFASRAPDVTFRDNVIVGVGTGGGDSPYAIDIGGILVENAAVARAFGNRIENAHTGVIVGNSNPSISGSDGGQLVDGGDNVIDQVETGIGIFDSSAAILRSSDVTGYVQSVVEANNDGPIDLTCNWWGTPAGPQDAGVSDPSVFVPWATSPVAGTSTTTCSGGI